MKRETTTLIAFLTVPVIPSLISAVLQPMTKEFDALTLLVFAAISYLISAAVAGLLGAPIFYWLLRIDLVRWWSALIAGFFVGTAVAVMVRLPNLASLREVLLLGLEGAISAFVFWLIWKQGREPSSTKNDDIRQGK
jgi:hypothetical protein